MASQIAVTDQPNWKEPRKFGPRFQNGFPIGKRTKERQKQNAKLRKLPDSVKKLCEIRLPGCLGNKFLSWAHSSKSRYLVNDRDWQEAARSCGFCHDAIEAMSHSEMKRIVCEAIAKRRAE